MADPKEQLPTPPYVAYKTLANFLRSLSQAVPSRIDKSVMTSMSGGAQMQILHALKYLKLINPSGAPLERLPLLVKSEGAERQRVLRETLVTAYPFLANKSIDLSNATMHLLEDEFKKLAGGDTVRKCMAFFVPAALDAGMELSPYIKQIRKRQSNGKSRKKPTVQKSAGIDDPLPQKEPSLDQPPQPPTLSWHELLLSKFPSFDPSWTDEVKAKWFTGFEQLMKGGSK